MINFRDKILYIQGFLSNSHYAFVTNLINSLLTSHIAFTSIKKRVNKVVCIRKLVSQTCLLFFLYLSIGDIFLGHIVERSTYLYWLDPLFILRLPLTRRFALWQWFGTSTSRMSIAFPCCMKYILLYLSNFCPNFYPSDTMTSLHETESILLLGVITSWKISSNYLRVLHWWTLIDRNFSLILLLSNTSSCDAMCGLTHFVSFRFRIWTQSVDFCANMCLKRWDIS